ncbi:MAG TPA: 2'-5' RNA ligase family protein [Flavisolibacter sp.]|nr:2'-5' RNA ligase family protein [Flavisolibacter sp.]
MEMYFIAHVLPAELNEKILAFKQLMLERYECRVGLKSPAHITMIAPFWEDSGKENNLITDLDLISSEQFPFMINTLNFGAFKPRTIFVDVKANDKLNALKSSVERQLVDSKKYSIKAEDRPFIAHITIATRDLHKKSFSEAWAYFENKRFEEQWMADSVSLLRHNKKNWDVIHASQFSITSEQAIKSH